MLILRALLVVAVLLLAGCGDDDDDDTSASSTVTQTAPAPKTPKPDAEPMTEARFWSIVEAGPTDKLTARLRKLNPQEIVGFERELRIRTNEAYRWDLWAAAYIVNGGCSDDCFDYFQGWLIGQGRKAFERVLADPERLADYVTPAEAKSSGGIEDEALLGAAYEAYEAETGQAIPDINVTVLEEPKGKDWDEETVDRVHPKLARRFAY